MYLFNIRRKYMPGGSIVKRSVATATVSLPKNSYTYTGEAITPTVTVRLGDMLLTVNEDYTVTYSGNTDVGMATVTITGMGNFYGTRTADFYITAAPTGWAFKVEDMEHVGSASMGYSSSGINGFCEDYSNTAGLLIGRAWTSGRYAFGNLITKDSQNKFHVANYSSSFGTNSNGSSPYLHLILVSDDGKTTFWRSNGSPPSDCVKATCSTPFDFQNLSFDTSNVISAGTLEDFSPPTAPTFADGGSRVFYANNGRRVHSVRLSSAYDFSTFDVASHTYVDITEVPSSYTYTIHSILFNSNGTRVLMSANTKIYQFLLTTPFDLTTRTLESEATGDADFYGLAIVNNGTTLFGMASNGVVHEYNLTP